MQSATVVTRDLDLASYLLAEGAELLSVGPSASSNRQEFALQTLRSAELVAAYTNGTALVSLDAFRSARRDLLDRLHRSDRVSGVVR